jgi:hypothetical protein
MDAASAITAAAVIIALVALYFTGQQVKVAKQQTKSQQKLHEDAAQPYVWVDLRPTDGDGHIMLLVVRNEGPTVATDVQIAFDPPVPTRWDASKDEDARTSITLASMPPGAAGLVCRRRPRMVRQQGREAVRRDDQARRSGWLLARPRVHARLPRLRRDRRPAHRHPQWRDKALKDLTKQLKDQARRRPPPAH